MNRLAGGSVDHRGLGPITDGRCGGGDWDGESSSGARSARQGTGEILAQPGGGDPEDVCIVTRWTGDEDVAGLSGDCFGLWLSAAT